MCDSLLYSREHTFSLSKSGVRSLTNKLFICTTENCIFQRWLLYGYIYISTSISHFSCPSYNMTLTLLHQEVASGFLSQTWVNLCKGLDQQNMAKVTVCDF